MNKALSLSLHFLVCSLIIVAGCSDEIMIKSVSSKDAYQLREKYEVQLFNHLMTRGEFPLDRRYSSIRQMAEEGFEPAALALGLFDIQHSDLRKNDPAAQKRLEELAEQGNPTAQCLYVVYWSQYDLSGDRWQRIERYVVQASDAGAAFCIYFRAKNFEKSNLKESTRLSLEAAHMGDLYAQTDIAYAYESGQGVEMNLTKAFCWAMEAQKSNTDSGRGVMRYMLFSYRKAYPERREMPSQESCDAEIGLR